MIAARMLSAGKFLMLASSLLFLIGAGQPERTYAEGQVWEYRTRAGDEGSLLKIQKIEVLPEFSKEGPVYHVSIIGVHFPGLPIAGELQHAPFFKRALDASVTKLASTRSVFPDPGEGIAQWKEARGGIFTISVADAVNFAEQTLRRQMLSAVANRTSEPG